MSNRQDIIKGTIEGIQIAADVMRANAADEFDRAFLNRTVSDLNKRLEGLMKEQAAPPPEPWQPTPPQPCPLNQKPTACYRRDGEKAVIEVALHGRLCHGCERKIDQLEGIAP